MQKTIIRTVPGPDDSEEPQILGQMVKPDKGEPFGTTPLAEEMLQGRGFEYYHAGWSNGYVETKAV